MHNFAYYVYPNQEATEPISGADTLETAEKIAKAVGGVVREAVLFRIEGDCLLTKSGLTIDGDYLHVHLLKEFGGLRSTRFTHDFGWVEITIKSLPEPEYDEGEAEEA